MPISKHELRLGSQLQHCRVVELREDFAGVEYFDQRRADIVYAMLDPLPLTQGYLIVAGFEPYLAGWHRAGLFLLEEPTGWYMRQGQAYVSNQPILSVHHLQNLYQALTSHILLNNTDDRDDFNQNT